MCAVLRIALSAMGSFTKPTEFFFRRSMEVVGMFVVIILEVLFGRRFCLVVLQMFVGFGLLYAWLVQGAHHSVYTANEKLESEIKILHCIAIASSGILSLIIWFTLSVYPNALRAKVFVIFTSWAGVTELMAPLFMEIMVNSEATTVEDATSPYFMLSIGHLSAAFFSSFFPNILGKPFPESFDDVAAVKIITHENSIF